VAKRTAGAACPELLAGVVEGVPHTRVFLAKSAKSIEKKRVEFLVSAKKCKRAEKSAQEYQNKGDESRMLKERTVSGLES